MKQGGKKIFLDANIIIDLINNSNDFSNYLWRFFINYGNKQNCCIVPQQVSQLPIIF